MPVLKDDQGTAAALAACQRRGGEKEHHGQENARWGERGSSTGEAKGRAGQMGREDSGHRRRLSREVM